jgi:predicted nucleic acid-binding protein
MRILLKQLTAFSTDDEIEAILKAALDTGLSFYDASYYYVAKTRGLTLVTEDTQLIQVAIIAGIDVRRVDEI